METTAYIALSRQGALRRELSAIANNIANMNTTAFKSERLMFVDHLERSRSGDFIADQKLSFVRDVASYRNTMAGSIEQTGNPLDVAIHGKGYLAVQAADGSQQYTRNGSMRLDNAGQLVTQAGLPVLTDAGTPIFFAPEDTTINISEGGTVSTENGTVGRLNVVMFESEIALESVEGGLYKTDQQPFQAEDARLVQHALEKSNVEGVLEMTRMIEVSRSYKSIQDMIKKEDERIRKAVNELAKYGNS